MRVISGTAKGRRLATPARTDPIRPVLDQVKEAIFNILFDVSGARVLDCFAGTGALGIEALSRGTMHATFIDLSSRATDLIRKNIELCHFTERATVLQLPATKALQRLGDRGAQFDLIFIDPPYEQGLLNPALAAAAQANLLAADGFIIMEHHPKEAVEVPPGLSLTDQRKYGQTLISFCRVAARTETQP